MSNHKQYEAYDKAIILWNAVAKIAELCHFTRKELEIILGFSAAKLSRFYQAGGRIDPYSKEGEIALLLIRMYRSLLANVGDDEAAARAWLDHQNDYFNGLPREHIHKISGLYEVVAYLDAMRGKL